ncbi:MAG TPA: hypothetical protein DCE47_19255, partial [Planctomycetaceae bacterium]|nr:hypothetical protein [Planctomycetaceae bacterium]
MRLTSWIDSLRNRLASTGSRRRWQSASRNVEALEDRTLLSVTSLFVNGLLSVTATSGESIRITTDTTLNAVVEVDGEIDTNLPQVLAADVEQIEVIGGDGDNVIDLIDVRSAIFSHTDPGTGDPITISINGSDGQDTIDGSTDLDDVILGGDGDDVIRGGTGNNHIDGGDGNDNLSGGAGNDNLIGEDGQDTLRGENGVDTLSGGNGRDSLMGDDGNDSIDGGHGHDTLLGGNDNDSLNGGDGHDSISGGPGDDSLTGGIQSDTLIGGTGDDTALGNTGEDYLEGGTGDDLLVGGHDSDTLLGEMGNDKLNGQRDNDSLDAGLGDDTIFGGHGNDTATGNDGDDTIHGQGGNDFLFDDTGDDLINGGTGRDLIDSRGNFFTVDDVQLDVEGSAGETSLLTFTVTLTGSITSPATIDYTSQDNTATAGADYLPVTGTLIFQPGTSTRTIDITVFGDGLAESDEIFYLKLSNAVGAKLFDDTGEGRIIDDEPPTQVGTTVNVTRKAGGHTEIALAVNPINDQNIIVAPIDTASISTTNGRDAVWVTSNGGTSWQRVVIPNPVGQTESAGDPTITFDRFGNAVYGHMTYANLDQTTGAPLLNLASAFSSDGGLTWTAGVITSGDNNDDKLWISVGPDHNNPSQDVFYTTWHRLNTIEIAQSTDGINWSPMVDVSDGGGKIDSTVAVGPNGVVTNCWVDFGTTVGEAPIECDISTDGGQSWGTDRTAWTTNVNPFNDESLGDVYLLPVQPDRKFLSTISLEYDLSTGPNRGRLYLAFVDQGDLDGNPDSGVNNTVDHDNLDVFVITSDNNGNTWTAPTRINDDTGVNSQIHSWLAVDPMTGKIGIFWQDARN